MAFIVAQCIGVVSVCIDIASMQFKARWQILICVCLVNLLNVPQLILLDSVCGACLCAWGVVQILVNTHWVRQEKSVPWLLLGSYAIVSSVIIVCLHTKTYELMLIASAWLFPLKAGLKKEQSIRKASLANTCVFFIYQFLTGSYPNLISGAMCITSTSIALYRYRQKMRTTD